MVRQHRDTFITNQRKVNSPAIVLDVPLLFETGSDVICDYVIVVYASAKTIARRAMARPGMNEDKLASILASQMSPDDKRKRADLLLDSDLPKDQTLNLLIDWLCLIGIPVARKDSG